MGYLKIQEETSNSSVYKKARKRVLEIKDEINCSYCPYHRGENLKRRIKRSWKRLSKRKTQYKNPR